MNNMINNNLELLSPELEAAKKDLELLLNNYKPLPAYVNNNTKSLRSNKAQALFGPSRLGAPAGVLKNTQSLRSNKA
jgi:hypothetical protein